MSVQSLMSITRPTSGLSVRTALKSSARPVGSLLLTWAALTSCGRVGYELRAHRSEGAGDARDSGLEVSPGGALTEGGAGRGPEGGTLGLDGGKPGGPLIADACADETCANIPDQCAGDAGPEGAVACSDACPDDPLKTQPGICGCGEPESDADGDGTPDCADRCATDPGKVEPGSCGCLADDIDSDGDGLLDCMDRCDGVTDTSYIADDSCGVGYCRASNTPSTCVNGVETECVPGAPLNVSDATCDGIDDDCDGQDDEDYVPSASACGTGACSSKGTLACFAGAELDSCTPGAPAAGDVSCEGIDDDCDGLTDEDYIPTASACGTGACARKGTLSCGAGTELDSCTPGAPAASDATCDWIDDDCDGQTDEDFVPVTCRPGQCGTTPDGCGGDLDCGACPPGCTGNLFAEHGYLFCNTPRRRPDAETDCVGAGMHLVRLNDAAENAWVRATANAEGLVADLWIGANDLSVEGQWRWPDGTQFWQGTSLGSRVGGQFSAWRAGEPNNSGNSEDCAHMKPDAGWNDDNCDAIQFYVCEY